jgi:hypothetical protein
MVDTTKTADNGAMGPSDSLKKDLDWYIGNQKDLAAKYDGKVLLIFNQALIGVFDSFEDAYTEGAKRFEIGTFSLQPCSPDSDSYSLTIHTPYLVLT